MTFAIRRLIISSHTSASLRPSSLMAYTHRLRTTCPSGTRIPNKTRAFHASPIARFPRKDTQDKDSLKPESTEYSKSGSDDAVAQGDAAFDPSTTTPEGATAKAEQESGEGQSSLNASPGNSEVSDFKTENQTENSPATDKSSGAGSAPKAGGDKSG
ncbi:hypothetical protein LTS18_004013 [Coniosporium uncinatum]|uniref:Uncharacterized protein n=1 Tax=Coniosporium uncinatum TaxID=93489 RepID=A0ACC3DST7_9PEZI|nr:hypothetical protein LTS18_004013 [Coniosporium uncinatum]